MIIHLYCPSEKKVLGSISLKEGDRIDAISFAKGYSSSGEDYRYHINKLSVKDHECLKCPSCGTMLRFKSKNNEELAIPGNFVAK